MTDLNNFDSINIIFNEISERYFEKIGAPETWEILRRPQFGTFGVPRSSNDSEFKSFGKCSL